MKTATLIGLADGKILNVTSMIKLIEMQLLTINEVIIPTQEILIQLLDGIEPLREQSL